MLRPGGRVIAAVSSGADSVFLAHALLEIGPRAGARLAGVAHLNHKLRGAASDGDESFVEELAGRLGVPFYRQEVRMLEAGGNLEQAARRARLRFFAGLTGAGKADRVATGHTRDDQAETVLFRLMRGSGLAGLAGILPVTREGLIRPLIETSREEIEEFLRERGIEWREDASNADPRFARNRIRHGLLPQLEREWNPQLRQSLARMADLAREEDRWWGPKIAKLAAKTAVEADGGVEIRSAVLTGLPRAAARRLVRELVRRAGGRAPEMEHVEKAIALAWAERGSGCLEVPGGVVVRSFDWLRFAPAQQREPGENRLQTIQVKAGPGFRGRFRWGGSVLCVAPAERPEKSGQAGCVRLKWKGQKASALLELRGWKDGDHYRPCGYPRDQKLKEMFQKARVPSWKRGFWPIITDGCNILWARQFGAAAEAGSGHGPGAWMRIWEETAPE